ESSQLFCKWHRSKFKPTLVQTNSWEIGYRCYHSHIGKGYQVPHSLQDEVAPKRLHRVGKECRISQNLRLKHQNVEGPDNSRGMQFVTRVQQHSGNHGFDTLFSRFNEERHLDVDGAPKRLLA